MQRLRIKNFRSVAGQDLELAPMTVVYGANGAGKSSLLYSLLTLKNIVITSNQATSGFFNFTFASLGGFNSVVFNHKKAERIRLGLDLGDAEQTLKFDVLLGENEGQFELVMERSGKQLLNILLAVPFPYPVNQQKQATIEWEKQPFVVTWNGITAQIQPAPAAPATPGQPAPQAAAQPVPQQVAAMGRLQSLLNANVGLLRRVSVVPLRRGFTKPVYTVSAQTPLLITEDEVATLLANEPFLPPLVSHYLEEIVGREFRVVAQIGTGVFSLQATDRSTGVAAELVNEGFGVNQLVFLLARCLHHDTELVCVEEPEIHLHPTAVRSAAKVLLEIIQKEGKQFIISTHSTVFLSALLAEVARGHVRPSDLALYYVHKEKRASVFERQEVNEKGQAAGALKTFVADEMEDVQAFLGTGATASS